MDPINTLEQETRRVQASGVLGEARMRRLFDYLAARSLAGESPKEITLAIEVFGKGPEFDVSQDALVRVYVHKLRRTLEEFYAAQGGEGITPLHIPRGEYRLILSAAKARSKPSRPWVPRTAGVAALAALGGGALALIIAVGVLRWQASPTELERARANPIWSALLKDDRPLMVVVGDYYLIGETDPSMEVKRLIREFSVNSKSDLDNFVQQHPEVADKYMDVGLRYLPTSTAFALRNVMPVLGAGRRHVSLSVMSDVTPAALKSADIVYIGYLSGLGILERLVFSGSRFTIGGSYDEIIDTRTKHLYISQTASQNIGAPQNSGKESAYRDYGFFSSFRGPGGNLIVVISGTRDEGVRQTAETFTNPEKLTELGALADAALPFEALLEVSALDGVNLSGKVLLESKR
ncbi:MAG: hypothetical protein WA803_00340 [Steroidobacteraceae bacterium]